MADNNTENDHKSKKKHKWLGIFLMALLLLFIGLTGYYLERDLEPVPDSQITEDGVINNGANEITESENSELKNGKDTANGQNSINERGGDSQNQNDLNQELEEKSTLLDRVLSILGLSESDFAQDLNILFIGLDDEKSVKIGSIEADSIMIARLRPEADKLELEHIDEDLKYQGQVLRKYYNGDIRLAIEDITETEIDYYVYVNYQGFEKVIDEIGGVKVSLKHNLEVPGLGLKLKKGDNLLSGKEALNFVRWSGSNSLDRFERQKILINAVIHKLQSNNILFNVKDLYNTIVDSYNSVETDINPVLTAEILKYIHQNDKLQIDFIE